MVLSQGVKAKVRRFFHWWGSELVGLVPASLRFGAPFGQSTAWLAVDDGNVRLVRLGSKPYPGSPSLTGGEGVAIRRLLGPLRSVLLLPGSCILRKSVRLPLAAEDNLANVLLYELDRLTPFRPEQVYHDHRVLGRDNQQLEVELLLCPRAYLDPLLQSLEALGISPNQITESDLEEGSDRLPFNLLPREQRPRFWRLPQLINTGLIACSLGLLALWLVLPLYQLEAQADRLEPLLKEARAEAETAKKLRTKLQRLGSDVSYLSEKRDGEVKKLEVLNELTLILPDDTWIQQLQIQGREVQLQGHSAGAATVVQLLENSPMLNNVKFRSPVTRDARTDTERFFLSAELVGWQEG